MDNNTVISIASITESGVCSTKCCGYDGYAGGCCSIENRNWIIGAIPDAELFLQNLSEKLGYKVEFSQVFYTYEEGKQLFPNVEAWQRPSNYPALRVNMNTEKKYCNFYNETLKFCGVYDIRPYTCRVYKCDYLKSKDNHEG
jgi:Fe-S-cluster containining protein